MPTSQSNSALETWTLADIVGNNLSVGGSRSGAANTPPIGITDRAGYEDFSGSTTINQDHTPRSCGTLLHRSGVDFGIDSFRSG